MYNEQIENFINLALADGILTEKEKQILFKRAEAAGIDLDEFEMVLDARLFQKKEAMNKSIASSKAAPKSDKYGDIKKCPACGAMVQSFQTKCTDCDHEFSNIAANVSINKLFEMLNAAEESRAESSGGLFSSFVNNLNSDLDNIEKKKMTIISNFPIPNTKDDILEFLSLAVPKSKYSKMQALWNGAEGEREAKIAKVWRNKCEQIILKARFSMKEDRKTLDEINTYAKELKIK